MRFACAPSRATGTQQSYYSDDARSGRNAARCRSSDRDKGDETLREQGRPSKGLCPLPCSARQKSEDAGRGDLLIIERFTPNSPQYFSYTVFPSQAIWP